MATVEVALTAYTVNDVRLGYFRRVAAALRTNLAAHRHTLSRILVSSEILPDEQHDTFCDICRQFDIEIIWHPAPAELGRNHNHLRDRCRADYVVLTECDVVLSKHIDLSDDIDYLEGTAGVLGVRYDPIVAKLGDYIGNGLRHVGQAGPYLYSNRGSLWHRKRFDSLGPFLEDRPWGMQESDMAHRISRSQWTVVARDPIFTHIGHEGTPR